MTGVARRMSRCCGCRVALRWAWWSGAELVVGSGGLGRVGCFGGLCRLRDSAHLLRILPPSDVPKRVVPEEPGSAEKHTVGFMFLVHKKAQSNM